MDKCTNCGNYHSGECRKAEKEARKKEKKKAKKEAEKAARKGKEAAGKGEQEVEEVARPPIPPPSSALIPAPASGAPANDFPPQLSLRQPAQYPTGYGQYPVALSVPYYASPPSLFGHTHIEHVHVFNTPQPPKSLQAYAKNLPGHTKQNQGVAGKRAAKRPAQGQGEEKEGPKPKKSKPQPKPKPKDFPKPVFEDSPKGDSEVPQQGSEGGEGQLGPSGESQNSNIEVDDRSTKHALRLTRLQTSYQP